MDHMPGPIMATVAPMTATMIAVNECPGQTAKNIQIPTIEIMVPATGVQRPRNRNAAAADAIRKGSLVVRLAGSTRCKIP